MRVLLDTHVALALLKGTLATQYSRFAAQLGDPSTTGLVSVASLWEMAIKTRLGKLDPGMELAEIVGFLEAVGLSILPIEAAHVMTAVEPAPKTRDPFDRLLLAQCQVEELKFATLDRSLRQHPLVLRTL